MPVAVEKPRAGSNGLVEVLKLQEKGDYNDSDIVTSPNKENKKPRSNKAKTPKTPKNKKDGKLQMKISGFFTPKNIRTSSEDTEEEDPKSNGQKKISSFFTPKTKKIEKKTNDTNQILEFATEDRKRTESGESNERPDSGFSSRAETPAVLSEAGSKAGSPLKDLEDVDAKLANDDESEDKEDEESEEEEYEVEEILDGRVRKGKTEYLIKWKGYDNEEDNTWEPDENIDCEDKIIDFEKNRKNKEEKAVVSKEKKSEVTGKKKVKYAESSSEEESESDWDGDSDDGFKKAAKKPAPKKKGKVARERAAMNKPVIIPTAFTSELSAYEKIRNDNIKEREALLASLMADFQDYKKDVGLVKEKTAPKKRKFGDDESFRSSVGVPGNRRKSARLAELPADGEKPLGSQIWDAETNSYKEHKLAEAASDYDEEDYQNYEDRKKKRMNPTKWAIDPNDGFLMPEDITESMLNRVCDRYGQKTYNQNIGTTCHQCRQKTTDFKTICRSGECVGVRGQFCGRCLTIRYGEDAREALKDPEWTCPPCRNFCNCSICRNRNGKGSTGMLHVLAQSKGFDSVADYLKALTAKKGTDEIDAEDVVNDDEDDE